MLVTSFLRSYAPLLVMLLLAGAPLAAQQIHTCTIIPTEAAGAAVTNPVPDLPFAVQKAVSYKPTRSQSNLWSNGSTVTVRFLGGSGALQERVIRFAREWTQYANLNFRVVNGGTADIRVGFTQNGSSWSVVGRSSQRMGQDRPSMNFGWLNDRTPDFEVRRTVLHEFGHALGLLHEHQNPEGGIDWDEEAVYAHYLRTQGWDRRTTYNNVMATASHDATQYSAYDAASIMHYPVDDRLTQGSYSVGMNNELSATDKRYIGRLYPGRRPQVATTTTPPARPGPRPTPTSAPTTRRPTTTARPPAPRPTASSYAVRISNRLGDNQRAETVEFFVSGRKYTIQLDRNGRTRQDLNLRLRPGKYPYRVVTRSVYTGYRTFEKNGRRYRRAVEKTVPGAGSGTLVVDKDAALTLYGRYDEKRRRMEVYLGAAR